MSAQAPAEPAALPLLFLCRHGQTDWNAQGRIQGQRDIPLNDTGRAQAARNGATLREILGDAVREFDFIASPLGRTMETMRILRRNAGLPEEGFSTDARLKELHFGEWQGFTLAEMEKREPGAVAARNRDKWNYLPAGAQAESYGLLARRVRPVFERLKRPTILVAHGGITRAFLHLHAGVPQADAAHADILQDRVLRWQDGTAVWV
ncbi:histidine phosphatase family protein [Aureimonas populi]|uniref:Histidine phosphatase family protein n=1 Tax=Aureimonas populi TaxID=1701758 RepID=A0ABW5CM19_9HYPH|nr:histidine phosphatase family protein [Aureimonas populi]